jgi:hypothetical protein
MQADSQDQIPLHDAPGNQFAGGRALEGNGVPDYDHSQFFTRANSQDHVTQFNVSSYQPSTSSAQVSSLSVFYLMIYADLDIGFCEPIQRAS